MLLVGDIHGHLDSFRRKMKKYRKEFPNDTVVQVGDLGIGFTKSQSAVLPEHCKFVRGNHDNPAVCRLHPNYLGDFGSAEIDGHSVFFVSGAWSIDRALRIEGVDWWPEEELTIAELNTALDAYIEAKPEIMITHDAPHPASHYLLNRFALQSQAWYKESSVNPTRTGQALSAMFEAYQPKLWAFGHWHTDWEKQIGNTRFLCINELNFKHIDEPER